MKIYTRLVTDWDGNVLEEESYEYDGPVALAKGGGVPAPSAEERALQAEQTALLREQRDLLQRQLREQDLLSPLLLDELGLERVVDPTTGQLSGYRKRALTQEEQRQQTIEQRFRDLTLSELEAQAAGAPQRAEIETLTRERTLKALRGELEIDPTLTRELEQQEMTLREQLRAQLGPGYETSTPGIQALADFQRRKGELIYGAQRGEITLGEQLAGAREARGYERSAGYLPAAELSERLRTSRLGQVFGYATPGRGVDFGQLAGMFGDPINRAAQERYLRGQISAQGRSDWFNLFGTVAGAGAGAYATYAGLAALSDRRHKTDIKKVGKTDKGLPVYTFRYKGDNVRHMGVMAQDVEKRKPEAVVRDVFGTRYVDYARIS